MACPDGVCASCGTKLAALPLTAAQRRQMCDELLEAFAAALGEKAGLDGLPAVVAAEAVVWPYGDMDYELEGGCAWLGEQRLALAGDWCFNGRVEGAWLSGRAAAERVIAAA